MMFLQYLNKIQNRSLETSIRTMFKKRRLLRQKNLCKRLSKAAFNLFHNSASNLILSLSKFYKISFTYLNVLGYDLMRFFGWSFSLNSISRLKSIWAMSNYVGPFANISNKRFVEQFNYYKLFLFLYLFGFFFEFFFSIVSAIKTSLLFIINEQIFWVIHLLSTILFILITVAIYTLAERKLLAIIQRRVGPEVISSFGWMQPFADGFKAATKQFIIPQQSNTFFFLIAPIISFAISLIVVNGLVTLGLNTLTYDGELTLLLLIGVSSIGIYGVIFSGWASNSKYAFLGALRSSAQMISYEVSLGLSIMPLIMCTGSLNLIDIVEAQRSIWFVIPFLPSAIIFFVSALAETNRTPFDLPEAEAELVAGYNVEYSGFAFAMFFLAEYCNMIIMCILNVILFWGGWLIPSFLIFSITPYLNSFIIMVFFLIKILFYFFLFVLVRGVFPRYRYDQLMDLGWKVFLPFTLAYFYLIAKILLYCDGFYYLDSNFISLLA